MSSESGCTGASRASVGYALQRGSLPELAQAPLPVFGQHPGGGRDLLGRTKALEFFEPPDQELWLWAYALLPERSSEVKRSGLTLRGTLLVCSEVLRWPPSLRLAACASSQTSATGTASDVDRALVVLQAEDVPHAMRA
jgi:hypothetical protein